MRLKSPPTWLLFQQFVQSNNRENNKAPYLRIFLG